METFTSLLIFDNFMTMNMIWSLLIHRLNLYRCYFGYSEKKLAQRIHMQPFVDFINNLVMPVLTSYFDNYIFLQLDGSAMGNPASTILANLVMNDVHLLKIYVNDLIFAIPENKDPNILQYFNSYHKNI